MDADVICWSRVKARLTASLKTDKSLKENKMDADGSRLNVVNINYMEVNL